MSDIELNAVGVAVLLGLGLGITAATPAAEFIKSVFIGFGLWSAFNLFGVI